MANPLGRKLLNVERPARYIGGEYGAYCKNWKGVELRWCLAFPEVYEIGMSHLGLQILYQILNRRENILADRVYAPWFDMEELLKRENAALWALESGHPLREFDIVGITIPYELTYTNILSILDLGGIPILASKRGKEDPLIIGGGCGAFNPEPVADFFDAILLGDGEDAVLKISECVINARKNGLDKKDIVAKLAGIEGIYVPAYGRAQKVRRTIVKNIDSIEHLKSAVVPNISLVHDRAGIEIQRGCSRGCRFCQAGMIYRPDRQRKSVLVINAAEDVVSMTGVEECAMLSLSAGDYPCLSEVVSSLDEKFGKKWVHISLPSLRTESLAPEIVKVLARSLKGGFTLAPEAATERLRKAINKGNTEDDLLSSVEKIFSAGWKNLKLYFMIGLPTETQEDVEAIPRLVFKVLKIGRRCHRFPNITINISTFVPKAHTPFQRERQLTIEDVWKTHEFLRKNIKGPGLTLKLHDPRVSFLEGIFSRGDRSLSKVVISAFDKGCRFDAWEEKFDMGLWKEALKEHEIDAEKFLGGRIESEALPWEHLFVQLDRKFLEDERHRATRGELTPDCAFTECRGCGVCNFGEIAPIFYKGKGPCGVEKKSSSREGLEVAHKYYVNFRKTGDMIFVGAIDFLNIWRRAFTRSGLPLQYSKGFNPRPKLSFVHTLPIGVEGHDEWAEVFLTEKFCAATIREAVFSKFPGGIEIMNVVEGGAGVKERTTGYIYKVESNSNIDVRKKIENFYAADSVVVVKMGKKGERKIDIKKDVIGLAQYDNNAIEVKIQVGALASVFDVAKWLFDTGETEVGVHSLGFIKEKTCLMS